MALHEAKRLNLLCGCFGGTDTEQNAKTRKRVKQHTGGVAHSEPALQKRHSQSGNIQDHQFETSTLNFHLNEADSAVNSAL